MRIDITPGRGRISVGPPGGHTETIPASVTVTITDTSPYDVEARLEWSPTVGKLVVRKICCTATRPGMDRNGPASVGPRFDGELPADQVSRVEMGRVGSLGEGLLIHWFRVRDPGRHPRSVYYVG